MMYELVVDSGFSAAHKLRGYEGACEHLHGHNWRVQIVLRSAGLDRLGMVMDFKKVKSRVDRILGELDHVYLNELGPFKEKNPTTENIAKEVFDRLSERLRRGVRLARVTVWESDRCGASYFDPEQG